MKVEERMQETAKIDRRERGERERENAREIRERGRGREGGGKDNSASVLTLVLLLLPPQKQGFHLSNGYKLVEFQSV